jgi:hypothetical protein
MVKLQISKLSDSIDRYRHADGGRNLCRKPNNLDTGLRRYDAGRFTKRICSIWEIDLTYWMILK